MTEQRKKLIDKFQSWLDTDPRKQIIAAVCANIAEDYADEQLRLHIVSHQRELLEWLSNEDHFNIPKDEIGEILEDWKTYNSNCG